MNQEQLNAIKERVAKATPGPWLVEESRYEGRFNAASVDGNYDLPACLMHIEDAKFVTNAREDVPVLVAEVERLKIELDAACIANNTLKSDKAQLRKALEKIMEDQAPIMEGWETTSYEIARKALDGEAHE